MGFAVVAMATSVAGLVLGIGWALWGALLLRRWGMEAHADGLLAGRRLGAAYLGIALMLFLGRSAPASQIRDAVCAGMLCALVLMAASGVFEFKAGRVRAGILASVVLEAALAFGFGWVLVTG
jgi:hypothetical protein